MNLCVPVTEDKGLQSPVSAHFGSAPVFLIVDTESGACRAVPNLERHHGHGMCHPLRALEGQAVEGAVVGGIGGGALARLRDAGIRVYLSDRATVEAALSAFRSGSLREATPAEACRHHGSGPHGHGPHGHGAGGPHGAGQGGGGRRT
jgi:predicted Fe-Mo cluster-binding NifX family protein